MIQKYFLNLIPVRVGSKITWHSVGKMSSHFGTFVDSLCQVVFVRSLKVSLLTIETMVYTMGTTFEVKGPKSLKPYKIGIIRGYKLSEQLTKGLNRLPVNTTESLFKMPNSRRLDVILMLKSDGDRFLKENAGFEKVRMLEPPLYSVPLFHFLHKKHRALIPKLEPIFKKMLKDGVLTRLTEQYSS